jgi:hypothetical protein
VIATNSHDSHRLRQEQAQLDRTELRMLLDHAATALYVTEQRAELVVADRGYLSFTDKRPSARDQRMGRQSLGVIAKQVGTLTKDYNRLAIRLGRKEPVVTRLSESLTSANAILFDGKLAPGNRGFTTELLGVYGRFFGLVGRFVDAANRIAHSTLG